MSCMLKSPKCIPPGFCRHFRIGYPSWRTTLAPLGAHVCCMVSSHAHFFSSCLWSFLRESVWLHLGPLQLWKRQSYSPFSSSRCWRYQFYSAVFFFFCVLTRLSLLAEPFFLIVFHLHRTLVPFVCFTLSMCVFVRMKQTERERGKFW